MNELKALFYDMDGTLVYFKIDFLTARQKTIQILEKNGIPSGMFTPAISSKKTVDDSKQFMREVLKYGEQKIRSIMLKVNEILVELELKAALKAKAVNNICVLLDYVQKLGLKQIVCTYNTHHVSKITLKTAGIDSYIDDIFGRDDVVNQKPDKIHLQTAADKFNLKPQNCMMIGDHAVDIDAAKAFGCESIGIKRINTRKIQEISHADYLVDQNNISSGIIEILKEKMK